MSTDESIAPEETGKDSEKGRPVGGVARVLRKRRVELGQDIEAVSRYLRIRPIYLEAIEEGRLENLPGPAYAIGFVRAYADYLGLNGGSVVDDYREELAEGSRRNSLIWPADQAEHKHFPGTLVLIICLALAGGLYGAWYYTSQPGGIDLDFMPKATETPAPAVTPAEPASSGSVETPVPDTASAASDSADQPLENEASAAADAAIVPAGATAASSAVSSDANTPVIRDMLATGDTQAQTGLQPATDIEEEDEVTPIPSEGGAIPANPLQPQLAGTPSATAPETGGSTQNAALPGLVEPGASATGATVTGITATGATVPWASIPGSAVPEGTQPGRVQLRAEQDSWVEVRDAANKLILQRVLRGGEVLQVPDLPGLTLVTGNAGGLVVEVDGKAAPSLGPVGVVRSDIRLDPNVLTAP
jgi:cytoskeleton protein RodZ